MRMRLTNELFAELSKIEDRIDFLNAEILLPIGMDHGWQINEHFVMWCNAKTFSLKVSVLSSLE